MSPLSSPPRVALDTPPSQPAKKQGVGCIVAFCALFSLIGAGLVYALFLRPVAHVVAARSWSAVPCRIVSSNVASHSDSDGTTYSADIVYSYLGSDQITYTSGRYSFGNKIKAGYKGRAGIVAAYPVGSTATCYVNPRVPTEAVLQRGMTGEVWFGLMGLPFLAFGLFGIWAVTRSQREELHPRAKWQPKDAAPTFDPLVLRPKSSPWGRLAGMSFVNAFWNGIVGFMVWKLVIERDGGIGFAVFGFFFFIPFVLIGILIFWGWIQTGLALGNARPTLVLSRSLFPGQNADLRFELNGGIFWPQSVEITLEGREEASFTRGTDTITDTSPFFFQSLHQTSEVRGGNCAISIPTCTMHSLDAPHNKIVWILKLSGPIKHWPDIAEEWPITVFPAPTERNYE
ncbi:MAG TPA: DUF3592 domain-containing protein [Abditibacterium sp.]|jgi:hypothetical protein